MLPGGDGLGAEFYERAAATGVLHLQRCSACATTGGPTPSHSSTSYMSATPLTPLRRRRDGGSLRRGSPPQAPARVQPGARYERSRDEASNIATITQSGERRS